ncbi:PQQ-binding-like beta-propeller repeat protein [Sphingomonas hengshuiensis]|uniref:Regulatory protein n=1 Tax=Sphingomonas hengshuiensis TaxID=1609977 RepID=A0A7U4LFE7_9SPHN|nr:hypothetical protein [Sphingomonas hengshuiensis]AJP72208.1 regulatory protein [Sphingomonas hengshuiensis]
MAVNLSNSLAGLSLLTGTGVSSSSLETIAYESKAVRTAKAQFTLAATTPPWKETKTSAPLSSQVSTIKAMKTVIDKAGTGSELLPEDVQTSFIAYKALDRLRLLAEAASVKTASSAQRATLQTSFAKGLADVQAFLAKAPSDKVNLAFAQPSRSAKTIDLSAPDQYAVKGPGLVKNRTDAIPGLTGSEVFTIKLDKPGATDTVTVDLAQGTQPPTLDSVAAAINAAITAIPRRNADGSVYLDENGESAPRWLAQFEVQKGTDKWGLTLKAPSGLERVTLDQVGAKDALVVATGQTALDAPTATSVFRIDDPSGAATRKTMATLSALDRQETARATLLGKTTTLTTTKTDLDGKIKTQTTKTNNVYAPTDAAAVATDAQGNSYVVGTTQGDLGANRSDGDDNLFLTKMDGEGKIVWQRSLGAGGSSTGAAVSIAPDGGIVVAATVNGSFNGATADGDMAVAKFDAEGDEQFSTVVRAVGADTARALAVGADGSIFVGGRVSTGGGDAFVARIDSTGAIAERSTLSGTGSETLNGLAIDGDGNVLALMASDGVAEVRKLDAAALSTELGRISLGSADARVIAVGADGSIAVGGATDAALTGTQVNATGGGRDGFVARIDSALSSASVTYLGSSADDQVDSLAFMGGTLYAGGRTTGTLGAAKLGATDGFVARIDPATGGIADTNQFGASLLRTEPVRIAANVGGANALSALGFARGTVNPEVSEKLTTQTALRPGDSFSIRVNEGTVRKITISADDTLTTLADRIRGIAGASKATVTTPKIGEGRSLRIDMKAGNAIELLAGPDGTDALAKLGLDPQRIQADPTVASGAPRVRPGGTFGLGLSEALNLTTLDDAKVALKKMGEAVSMSQTAYRSLYWDDGKARLVDGVKNTKTGKGSTVRETAQLANYTAALKRLNSTSSSITGL